MTRLTTPHSTTIAVLTRIHLLLLQKLQAGVLLVGCLLLGIVGTAFGAAGDAYLGDLASASLSADNFGVYQGTVSALQTGCRDLPWYCMQSAARRAPLPLEG